jgi:hypothetical protein
MFEGNTGLRITKLLLRETGTYNQQYRRPYNTVLTGETLGMFQERLVGAQKFTPMLFSGLANQFITPTAGYEKQIDIVNGWNEQRMRFIMEIVYDSYVGGTRKVNVMGYTNYMGLSHSLYIDPKMEFFVNSIVQIRETVQNTPLGVQSFSNVFDNSHILVDNGWNGIYDSFRHDQRLRPEDVYTVMTRTHLPDNGNLLDARNINNTVAVKSRRSNGLASEYMAKILDGYNQASVQAQYGQDNDTILSEARGIVGESPASRDPFLSAIAQVRHCPVGNIFTFSDLQRLDPNVDNVTVVSLAAPTERASLHITGQTADWGASDRSTHVATILSQSVTGLLLDYGLTRVVFMSTNRNFGGATTTTFIDVCGFSTGDLSPQLEAFKSKLENGILRDISMCNQTDFMVEMQADLLGETRMRISVDGGPVVDYVTPTFCDALMVPVLTSNNDLTTNLANDFEALASALTENPNTTSAFSKSASDSFGSMNVKDNEIFNKF